MTCNAAGPGDQKVAAPGFPVWEKMRSCEVCQHGNASSKLSGLTNAYLQPHRAPSPTLRVNIYPSANMSHLTSSSSISSLQFTEIIIGQSAISSESQPAQRYPSFSYYAYIFVSEHGSRTIVGKLQRRSTSSTMIPFLTYFISID